MSETLRQQSGRLREALGIVWIEGAGWSTGPAWVGPLRYWKARRYAKRNGIVLT